MVDFNIKPLEASLDFSLLRHWDVVIVGAGPAGLAASLTTAHRALTTLVIEAKDKPGGQPQFLYADKRIVDIPGFPDGITGEELSERTYRQAVNALVQSWCPLRIVGHLGLVLDGTTYTMVQDALADRSITPNCFAL